MFFKIFVGFLGDLFLIFCFHEIQRFLLVGENGGRGVGFACGIRFLILYILENNCKKGHKMS